MAWATLLALLASSASAALASLGHDFQCDLPDPVDPDSDGLPSANQLFSSDAALKLQIERLRASVQIATVCYDDMGNYGDDERWKPFYQLHEMLDQTYPKLHQHTKRETVNDIGLVYTIQGSDSDLKPILLLAHQDVVPVESQESEAWEHPPFDGFYDSDGWLHGRGAVDKSSLTSIMSAFEALFAADADWKPERTMVLAFGFDEECGGLRGAPSISEHLKQRYGQDGIAVILDEGGAGLNTLGDTLWALPAVYEKGYLDVWFDLSVQGGPSGTPPPNTAIGIMSEIVTGLEQDPFQPSIPRDGPIHHQLICQARYSPDAVPQLTTAIYNGDLDLAATLMANISRHTQSAVQTTRAIDYMAGGSKINSLPEYVTLGINHRFTPQDNKYQVMHDIAHKSRQVLADHDITLVPFEDDNNYHAWVKAHGLESSRWPPSYPDHPYPGRPYPGHPPFQPPFHPPHQRPYPRPSPDIPHWRPDYHGKLTLSTKRSFDPSPVSPTQGPVWDLFAGTLRHTLGAAHQTV
ncbi:hypothetical protein CDD82_6174 [Ophiocordyceps australis]|uniref:Uncharacterized protein n=1 Tax=Ophiocordyceps australis TaxID=1399860 RepID=A0A2C5YX52_9HYPO|nr:hypothetical protein CDD82_6174 [Ophiocordyceps australis]